MNVGMWNAYTGIIEDRIGLGERQDKGKVGRRKRKDKKAYASAKDARKASVKGHEHNRRSD